MDNREIKQQLLLLENRDVVQKWFLKIHNRKLNLRRTIEINSAAKQSSEFMKNAELANFTVRPLLTFYGISTLSRAIVLLLKEKGGEESLTARHGLKTMDWAKTLSGDLNNCLKNIGNLKIETCKGLFSDLIEATNNRISIHVNSGGVDWRLCYNIPKIGVSFSFNDLISRILDLKSDLKNIEIEEKYCSVSSMTYSDTSEFNAKVYSKNINSFKTKFESFGYTIKESGNNHYELVCSSEVFKKHLPLFLHNYIHKTVGAIPNLHIVQPFDSNEYYSEIAITYLLSYYLGMLVRYFPTQWNSLVQGEKGDVYWTILNRSQNYVERVFPELIIELINDILETS